MKYKFYKHTNKTTRKSYIGYTSQCVQKRWKDHVRNALNYNHQTRFYHAIRKYGPDDWECEILYEIEGSKEEALKKEKDLIEEYNTYKTGYNATDGGTGGFVVKDIEGWKKRLSKATTGQNNPNYSGLSDEDILKEIVSLSKQLGYNIGICELRRKSQLPIPKHIVKTRFDGNIENLYIKCSELTGFPKYVKQQKSESHRNNLSKAVTGSKWYHNDITKKIKLAKSCPGEEWKLGRKTYENNTP